jgi:hypothetical protein
MSDIYLPVTYDAHDNPHIRQPHTTEEGAHAHARQLGALDPGIFRYEVLTMEMIIDE